MDFSNYQATPKVLERLKQVTLVAVVGPTAVGKSTVISAALARSKELHLVLNNTSRSPREGEQNGVDYVFRSRAEMLELIAERKFVQVAPSVLGDLYATMADGYTADGVAVMAILAQAIKHFRGLPFKMVRSIFIVPPDYATWQARIRQHGFRPDQLRKRLLEAEDSLAFALEDESTHFVINNTIDIAAEDFITLALAEHLSERQQADQSRGRQLVASLLRQLRKNLYPPEA